MKIEGIWLPIITPFVNNAVDFVSYEKLVDHYISRGISGLMPAATTGESPVLSDDEFERIVDRTVSINNGRVPIFAGLSGNYTDKVIKHLKILEKYKVKGILSASPYYNRPDQRGIYEHFKKISESTSLDIIIYNIPYRTGRNIENKTICKLAELKNIVGIKDSCGDIRQSMELLLNRPANFDILTGEDILTYSTLTLGGDGAILASSHLHTEDFIKIYKLIKENNHKAALEIWNKLHPFIPLLFEEPNPAPIKHYLAFKGMIASSEVRLPLMEITDDLKRKIEKLG
jgi:4-hydroxy-tetrahydrodipicolinate synthase